MDSTEFPLWTCDCQIIVPEGSAESAREKIDPILREVERAANRFDPQSEVSVINEIAQFEDVDVPVSDTLRQILEASFTARTNTNGLVDPEVLPVIKVWPSISTAPAQLDGDRLLMERGSGLDLGCLAKPLAADWCAEELENALVNLGGDIAVSGEGTWVVEVCDGPEEPVQDIELTPNGHCGVATSSTLHRGPHLISPLEFRPAPPRWRTVTVWAETCTLANCFSTACAISPNPFPLLKANNLSARLVDTSGNIHHVGAWAAN